MDSFTLLRTPCYCLIVHGMKPEIYSQVYLGDGKGTHLHTSAAGSDPRKQETVGCAGWKDTSTLGSALPPLYWVTSSGRSLTQFPHLGEEGSGLIPAQDSVRRDHSPSRFLSPRLPQVPGSSVSLRSS